MRAYFSPMNHDFEVKLGSIRIRYSTKTKELKEVRKNVNMFEII
jgi:hypothetical protein